MAKKYLDYDGLSHLWAQIKNLFVTDVAYDSTNKKITKTKAGSTSDVVTVATLKTALNISVPSAATATPSMDGTAAVGSSTKYAKEDHVHPSDTSRVPTTRTVNGKALSANITISAADMASVLATSGSGSTLEDDISDLYDLGEGAIRNTAKGAANGVCPLNASSKIDSTYLPSYVDDVIEAYPRSGQTVLSQNWLATGSASGTVIAPEAGKIYILMSDSSPYSTNDQFRWSGSAYVKLADGGVSAITNSEIDTILAS